VSLNQTFHFVVIAGFVIWYLVDNLLERREQQRQVDRVQQRRQQELSLQIARSDPALRALFLHLAHTESLDTLPVVPVDLDQCWRCFAAIPREDEVGLCPACIKALRDL
jgi:hypothetical protein